MDKEEFFKTVEPEPMPCMNDGCQDCQEDNCSYRNEPFDWGEPISIYTRADAIADGVLIDVSEIARLQGFNYPVAMTATARAVVGKDNVESVLFILRLKLRTANKEANRIDFKFFGHDVYALCHGGDNGEPVITVMLKGED